jgi:D-galactarolactone isomerase
MTDDLTAPRLKAPAGTCDTHLHIYGPADKYPEAPTSPFTPPVAPVEAYKTVMTRLGIGRAVVVQPSAYGKDNRCTLDAVSSLGLDRARAVVVVDAEATDETIEALSGAGAVGVRFHMLPGGVLPWEIIEEMAARVAEHRWHVQLQLDGRLLPERQAIIRSLPGRLVIDHTGKFLEPVKTDDPAFKVLLGLVERGNTWVKLSAPYETSKSGPPTYDDVGALARALIAAAPERMMWATNWPHPSAQPNPPDDAMLLDMLLDWCPDEATRHKILVDNPAGLYGFG